MRNYKMLKLLLLVIAISQTSLSTTAPPTSSELEGSIVQQLMAALPMEEIKTVAHDHWAKDQGYQAAIKYFKGPDWQDIVTNVRLNPEWDAYKDFLKQSGFDVNPLIRHFSHCLNATDTEAFPNLEDVQPNLTEFILDLKVRLAIPMIKVYEKFKQDDEVKKVLAEVFSPKSKEMLEAAMRQREVRTMLLKLKKMGVQVDGAMELLYAFFGWKPKVEE